jgi:hypothetical protein
VQACDESGKIATGRQFAALSDFKNLRQDSDVILMSIAGLS